MAKIKKFNKKKTKSKCKEKKQLMIGPRLRLEPRLTPRLPKKTKVNENESVESNSRLLNINGNAENFGKGASSQYDTSVDIRNNYQESEASNILNNCEAEIEENVDCEAEIEENANYEAEIEENANYEAEIENANYEAEIEESVNCEAEIDDDQSHETEKNDCSKITPVKQRTIKKRVIPKGHSWNDRELRDLAVGLQTEGFADLKKVAAYVKTKNENDVRYYLKTRRLLACKEKKSDEPCSTRGRTNWNTLSIENIETWPNIRKWRKLANNQMLQFVRNKEYSKPVISALCKRFYEEEKEPTDPQVINVKLIYKYMMDCMNGEIPPQLPPKESALVLDLLREVRLMPVAYGFEEELKFLNDFKEATKFKPFQLKDEFKKRLKKAQDTAPNTVSVPEEIFSDLSRHKRLLQSFNPLVTPVWMLQKEQELVKKYFEESNVYVA